MKARQRKQILARSFKQKSISEAVIINQPIQKESTPKLCRAFDLLFKELAPIQELVEDDLDIIEKKPRGRPRKWFPESEKRDDKVTHKIEDIPVIKPIGPNQRLKMIEMFRFHYRVNGLPLTASLNRIEDAFKISHRQAHQLLEKEF